MRTTSLVLIGGAERRSLIKYQLDSQQPEIVGEVDHLDALRLVAFLQPEVVLLDSATPGINALVALPWLANLPHPPLVIVLTTTATAAERRLMLQLGAVACAKLDPPGTLAAAFERVQRLAALLHGAPVFPHVPSERADSERAKARVA